MHDPFAALHAQLTNDHEVAGQRVLRCKKGRLFRAVGEGDGQLVLMRFQIGQHLVDHQGRVGPPQRAGLPGRRRRVRQEIPVDRQQQQEPAARQAAGLHQGGGSGQLSGGFARGLVAAARRLGSEAMSRPVAPWLVSVG